MSRVLIADRTASQRLVLRRLAESAGFEVDVVRDVRKAPRPVGDYVALVVDAPNWASVEESDRRVVLSGEGADGFDGPRLPAGSDSEELRAAINGPADPPTPAGPGLRALESPVADEGFLTRDARCQKMLDELDRLAPRTVSVLVQGESGTGKELIAHALHQRSDRSDQPFVAINCSAIPAELLESEVFGHERGAFTDAHKRHEGCFERAGHGTLFLDEIGDLPLELQPKLLRVLEARVLTRVGGEADIPVHARVLAATHRDLRKSVASGRFRADLYHRLAVATLYIPPLRERPADLQWLTRLFLRRLGDEYGQPVRELSASSWEQWQRHDWPGNVRELENLLRRGLLTQPEGPLTLSPEPISDPVSPAWADGLSRAVTEQLATGKSFEAIAESVRRAVDAALRQASPKAKGDPAEDE